MFVCIGNACRSPMAEGFANRYGNDALRGIERRACAYSGDTAPDTVEAMSEMNIDVSGHVPSLAMILSRPPLTIWWSIWPDSNCPGRRCREK